ncbi:MAG: 50S ribosomal protein L5 [Candidatus Micrarchaeota archaeon]
MTDMREILIEKVTVNIGVGSPGERLDYAKELIEKLSGATAVMTLAKKRNPVWKLRKGLPIGVKLTLRKKIAVAFLEKSLIAKRRVIKPSCFDNEGNFSFGVPEYIDFPGAKYDPKIGMFGFDVCVTLTRRGERVSQRRVKKTKIGKKHKITKDEAIEFVKKFNVKLE